MRSHLSIVLILCGVLDFSTADMGNMIASGANFAMTSPLVSAIPGAQVGQLGLGGAIAVVRAANKFKQTGNLNAALMEGKDSALESANHMTNSNPTLRMVKSGIQVVDDVRKGEDLQSAVTKRATEMAESNNAFKLVRTASNLAQDLTQKDLNTIISEQKDSLVENIGGDKAKMALGAMNDLKNGENPQSIISKNADNTLTGYLGNNANLETVRNVAGTAGTVQTVAKRLEANGVSKSVQMRSKSQFTGKSNTRNINSNSKNMQLAKKLGNGYKYNGIPNILHNLHPKSITNTFSNWLAM